MTLTIGVLGAGAIGGYLGLRLAQAGAAVTLVGRASLVAQAERLRAVTLDGALVEPAELRVTDRHDALADCELVLVTVKARGNEEAGRVLAEHAGPEATVVSFQNGLDAAAVLEAGRGRPVIAGMVSFNVVREADGARFVQATRGPLVCGPGRDGDRSRIDRLRALAERAQLPLLVRDDITDVLAGKLLLNLNNGICAVTGLPIVASLQDADARWCLSQCMLEGLTVLRAAGYRPANVLGLPPSIIARALRLPTWLLMRVAKKMVAADPSARSSTLQDLDAGKPTEIDALNGAVVALARAHGLAANANAVIVEHVRRLERSARPLPHLDPVALREQIAQQR